MYNISVTFMFTVDTSPIRCTPEEIKRKHKQAREKLLAKRLLPFTASPQENAPTNNVQVKELQRKFQFQPKVASTTTKIIPMTRVNSLPVISKSTTCDDVNKKNICNKSLDLRQIIEKKRQEALMKLRKRQPHCKLP